MKFFIIEPTNVGSPANHRCSAKACHVKIDTHCRCSIGMAKIQRCNMSYSISARTFNTSERCRTWFSCDMCKYKCKHRGNLKRHLAQKHHINVKWFACNICKFKCKLCINLKRHLAQIHDIDVKWFSCDIYEFKCKERNILKRHLAFKHNIVTSAMSNAKPVDS